jgi:hypothetical protein
MTKRKVQKGKKTGSRREEERRKLIPHRESHGNSGSLLKEKEIGTLHLLTGESVLVKSPGDARPFLPFSHEITNVLKQ